MLFPKYIKLISRSVFQCAFAYVNISHLEIEVNITKKVSVVQTKTGNFPLMVNTLSNSFKVAHDFQGGLSVSQWCF
jgi:hypothetical protein